MDAEGDAQPLIPLADKVVSECDACKAFAEAPHLPVAGTSTVAMFNGRLQMDLPFLDDFIALVDFAALVDHIALDDFIALDDLKSVLVLSVLNQETAGGVHRRTTMRHAGTLWSLIHSVMNLSRFIYISSRSI